MLGLSSQQLRLERVRHPRLLMHQKWMEKTWPLVEGWRVRW